VERRKNLFIADDRRLFFQCQVRIITEWGCPGLLTLAEINFFFFFKLHFYTFEKSVFNEFMLAVAKRLFFAQAATAPGIYFPRLHFYNSRFTLGDMRLV
jgi:hypothetical protein